jgi:hypothetical protein
MPDQFVHAMTTMSHLRHCVGAGRRLDVGLRVCLCDRSAGLRRSPGLDRERWSCHAQHGCGGKGESKFSHSYSPWMIVNESSFTLEHLMWQGHYGSPNYKFPMLMNPNSSEYEFVFTAFP